MRSKVTVVLLFLNVLLFYYIFQYERIQIVDSNGRLVLGPEISSADSLSRTSRTGPPVRLERRGETWWLTQPYDWPANPNAVQRLLNELKFLQYDTKFAVSEIGKSGFTLATYGLDQPALTLVFASGNKPYTLKIGDDSKIGSRLYLLSPDEKTIYVVGRSLADSVGLPLEDLRASSIFTIPVFEVRSLNVQTAALKVRLRRDGSGRWGFESPIQTRASKGVVEVTINSLNALAAKTFLEPASTDLERTGLNSPALRVTLEGNARRETLLLGGPAADGVYYAKIEDKAVVFTVPVPAPLLEVLRAAQDELRERRVLDFEPRTVTALTLAAPGRPELTLQRLEAGTSGAAAWQVVVRVSGQAPQISPADTAIVEELLQKLYLLAATKFLSDAPSATVLENSGFNVPEREITLSLNTGGGPHGTDPVTVGLQIGVPTDRKDVAFAKDTNLPYVYQILPDILGETPSQALYYRQRLLRDLPEGAKIQGLTLTDLTTGLPVFDRKLADATATWDAALASEPEARRKALTSLLAGMHTLRAKRFTAETFNPDHADTAQGARPWRYRLDLNLSYASGGGAQNSTATLFLTERLSGNVQLAGTPDFGGVVFEVSQDLLDALFALTYREANDPGLPPTAAETPAPKPETVVTPGKPAM